MSKNKKIRRKRFCKLIAAENGLQAREVRDDVRRVLITPGQRVQEKRHTAQHRKERAE